MARRPGFTPRVMADPRRKLEPKPLTPPKPAVKDPAIWSWAVQQILSQATFEAIESLLEKRHGQEVRGMRWIRESAALEEEVFSNPHLRLEFWEIASHFIDRVKPSDGFSSKGPPIDRAEARLRLWYQLFAR